MYELLQCHSLKIGDTRLLAFNLAPLFAPQSISASVSHSPSYRGIKTSKDDRFGPDALTIGS